MVHLNGSALSSFGIGTNHFGLSSSVKSDRQEDQSYSNEKASSPPLRRTRSSQIVRGPKPLLPRSLKEALHLAELLSKSKLTPKGFDTAETCLVGILYGMEVGLSPIAALQRMAVIDGRPTIWGDAALALVQASGLLTSIREEIVDQNEEESFAEQGTVRTNSPDPILRHAAKSTSPSQIEPSRSPSKRSATAVCTVRREGRSEPVIGTFSIEDAKRAGLWQKPGPWTDYPKRMLTMRARAFALRDAFPDVLAGLYLREEFVGKERVVAKTEHNRSTDPAEWNAAGAQVLQLAGVAVQPDEPHGTAAGGAARGQGITTRYDFTPNAHEQHTRPAPEADRGTTSGYDFAPTTHELQNADKPVPTIRQPMSTRIGETNASSANPVPSSRRRAPPPPPEGERRPTTEFVERSNRAIAPDLVSDGSSSVDAGTLFGRTQGAADMPPEVDVSSVSTQDEFATAPDVDAIPGILATESYAESDADDFTHAPFEPETMLDLLDSALCCALDEATFNEITDDFDDRLKLLSPEYKKQAQKIIDRHHKRVEELDHSSQATKDMSDGNESKDAELPRRIKTDLSHLGIGRSPSRDRRTRRKERPAQSTSWNARQRLNDFKSNATSIETEADDDAEGEP